MKYEAVIGLEVHIGLNTKSKMFCSCANDSLTEEPNTNICPICTGHPGTLPVINRSAVEKTLKTGLALNCKIPEHSRFDRKNYFYPDLPKGYQISQYDTPFCLGGYLEISNSEDFSVVEKSKIKNQKSKIQIKNKKIRIRRVHLEEDTGRLLHPEKTNHSLVDFNRAGIPLMELVTEPDITSAKEARKFTEELRLILRYLEVSNADMEKGEMRIDVNVSLSSASGKMDGTRIEIKNLNSFRSIERSLEYEIERQRGILEKGGKISQETRGWDDNKGVTVSQRSKEESPDYRYFPEPDLPALCFGGKNSFVDLEKLKSSIPELPEKRKNRLKKEYGLSDKESDFLVNNRELGDYYEKTVSELRNWVKDSELKGLVGKKEYSSFSRLAANYIISDLQGLLKESTGELVITPENFAEFILLIHKEEISSKIAKIVLKEMFVSGGDPSNIIREKGLSELKDELEIEIIIENVIAENCKAVEDYKKGKNSSLQFLIGQTMVKTKGRVNPEVIGKIIKEKISML